MATDRDETIRRESLLERQAQLKYEIDLFDRTVVDKLANHDSGVDAICAQLTKRQKELGIIEAALRSCDPNQSEEKSEQDRKGIAIIAGGRGVEIRARNDDASKYLPKKRKTYQEVKKKQNPGQSNGRHQQIYPTTQPVQAQQTV